MEALIAGENVNPVAHFEEEAVATIAPDPDGPYPDGLHTLSRVGDLTLVDGRRTTFVPWMFANGVRSKAARVGRAAAALAVLLRRSVAAPFRPRRVTTA